MASRRILKKNIHFLLHEVAMEAYVGYFLVKEIESEKFSDFIKRVYELDKEFVARVNHPSGTNDAKLVKAYYKKLAGDFNEKIAELIEDLKTLSNF